MDTQDTTIETMFEADTPELKQKIKDLAEFIAVEDDATSRLDAQLKERKANLDDLKTDLCMMLRQAGIESVKLDNGLTPKARVQVKYFMRSGIEDNTLFTWLKEHELDGIIKPHVAWNTLNSTLADYVAAGNDLDEAIFQKQERSTITLYGKQKFIHNRNANAPTATN